MDFYNILTDLKNKNYNTVYFLEGEEPYYIDLISDYILENVLSESEKHSTKRCFTERILPWTIS